MAEEKVNADNAAKTWFWLTIICAVLYCGSVFLFVL